MEPGGQWRIVKLAGIPDGIPYVYNCKQTQIHIQIHFSTIYVTLLHNLEDFGTAVVIGIH